MNQVLPVMEQFYTLQGEGYYAGTPAYFIRLAGCDIGCHWCDVKDSWEAANYPLQNVLEIIQEIPPVVKTVVITGGEPCIYDLTILTTALKSKGISINLETSGAYPIQGFFDWICISPKKRKIPLNENLIKAHELKIIIYNQDDFIWAQTFSKLTSANCKLFLQAEWSKKELFNNIIIDFIMQNPIWKLSVQTQKYLNIR